MGIWGLLKSQCKRQYVEIQNEARGASQLIQLLKRAIRFQGQKLERKGVLKLF